eukprot:11202949-Alexandrium_andersonii.AAC.1
MSSHAWMNARECPGMRMQLSSCTPPTQTHELERAQSQFHVAGAAPARAGRSLGCSPVRACGECTIGSTHVAGGLFLFDM